jgi:hypothetical protein
MEKRILSTLKDWKLDSVWYFNLNQNALRIEILKEKSEPLRASQILKVLSRRLKNKEIKIQRLLFLRRMLKSNNKIIPEKARRSRN